MRGTGDRQVWSFLVCPAAGSIAGVAFGIFDSGTVREASISVLPLDGWPGLGLSFGAAFWSLLPAFLFLAVFALVQGTSIDRFMQKGESTGGGPGRWNSGDNGAF